MLGYFYNLVIINTNLYLCHGGNCYILSKDNGGFNNILIKGL